MKKKLLLLAILLTFSVSIYSQENPKQPCNNCGEYDLVYDFKCKVLMDNSYVAIKNLNEVKIKHNQPVRIKIINLNKYLYSTTISYDDIIFNSTEPELFKNIFLGGSFKLADIGSIGQQAEESLHKVDSLNKVKYLIYMPENKSVTDTITNYDKFKIQLKDFKSEYNKLLETYIKAYSICLPQVNCCGEEEKSNTYTTLSGMLLDLKISYAEVYAEAAAALDMESKELTETEKKLKYTEEKLEELNKDTKKNKNAIAAKIAEKLDYETKIIEKKEVITNISTLKAALEKFKVELDAVDDEKIMKAILFENNFVADNFEYITPPIFPKGDILSITMNISPNTSEEMKKWSVMPLYEDEFTIDFRIRNKWFYSFSTGPFLAIGNKFKTETYGWQKQQGTGGVIDDTAQYKLVPTGKENLPMGIAAFANLGIKFSDFFGIGPSIGAGATIVDDPQITYFAGLSAFFGQDKQFNLTSGFSFMQVKELKSHLYDASSVYTATEDLDYKKSFKNGWFVSLTYTVFDRSTKKNGSSGSGNKTVKEGEGKTQKTEIPTIAATVPATTTLPAATPAALAPATDKGNIVIPVSALTSDTKIKIKN